MATPLEKALDTMVVTFHKYSQKEGDQFKLNNTELKELLKQELPGFISKKKDESTFQKIMSNLDSNKDNQVDFQEYATFLACIAMACNDFFHAFPGQDAPTEMKKGVQNREWAKRANDAGRVHRCV